MKNNIAFIVGTILVFSTGSIAISQAISEWEVATISPTPIGPQVARATDSPANPDTIWTVTDNGILQFVARDHDPKCHQFPGYVQVEGTPYPIPTSPPMPGKTCAETVNNLYHSRLFEVSKGSEVWGEQGSSGSFVFNFVTSTPSPTPTMTPTDVATAIPTPTHTPTPVPTDTPVPTSTPTSAVEPPTVPQAQCLGATPERLEDGTYLIWIDAINASGYTLYDGNGYLYFKEQPIAMNTLVPGVVYIIYVTEDDTGCTFQIEPTSLAPITQFGEFAVRIPFVSN